MTSGEHKMAVLVVLVVSCILPATLGQYEPNWASIDSRPLPSWYDEAKFGIFMHWGVFSVPSFKSAWFWYFWQASKDKAYVDFMKKNYPPGFTYADFGPMFKAELFDPNHWADILAASGAKYLVLTSKHHEGFTNWPSKYSWNWNAWDVGPRRDLVGELASAVRNRTHIRFGLYHSLFEWFNPVYLKDKASKYKTQSFVETKAMPELYEIVNAYKPEVVWSDGDWEAPYEYWNSTNFLAWLYNKSPVKDTVVTNDRWGEGMSCHHGGFFTCSDRYNPGVLQKHKWENAMTVDRKAWVFRRDAQLSDFFSIEELVKQLVETVSCGGNMLMNVGPTADGRIVPIFEERLRQMGSWLKVNGEAIYSSKPWKFQNDTLTKDVWWPTGVSLTLGAPTPSASTRATLLGYTGSFLVKKRPMGGMDIMIPPIPANKMPCQWGWVFRLDNLL